MQENQVRFLGRLASAAQYIGLAGGVLIIVWRVLAGLSKGENGHASAVESTDAALLAFIVLLAVGVLGRVGLYFLSQR